MKPSDDARIEELNNLRLALATFVLQLDAFEMRTHNGLRMISKPGKPVPRNDNGCLRPSEGQNDWRSIKSPGNKWDT
jgi:hypothetical protein